MSGTIAEHTRDPARLLILPAPSFPSESSAVSTIITSLFLFNYSNYEKESSATRTRRPAIPARRRVLRLASHPLARAIDREIEKNTPARGDSHGGRELEI